MTLVALVFVAILVVADAVVAHRGGQRSPLLALRIVPAYLAAVIGLYVLAASVLSLLMEGLGTNAVTAVLGLGLIVLAAFLVLTPKRLALRRTAAATK